MLSTGEKVKILLSQNNITEKELSDLTNLEISSIRNIIYNRSKKIEYISKIAKIFSVTTEYLLGKSSNLNSEIIDVKNFFLVSEILNDLFQEFGIRTMNKKILIQLIDDTYKEFIDNQSISESKSFAKGMIIAKKNSKIL